MKINILHFCFEQNDDVMRHSVNRGDVNEFTGNKSDIMTKIKMLYLSI